MMMVWVMTYLLELGRGLWDAFLADEAGDDELGLPEDGLGARELRVVFGPVRDGLSYLCSDTRHGSAQGRRRG